MKKVFPLAWAYMKYHRLRTVLLTVCIAIMLFLPMAVQGLVQRIC